MVTLPSVEAPAGSIWFGLQKLGKDGWLRCERADWAPHERWWRVADHAPEQVARAGFGEGTFRAIWCGEDKRKRKAWLFSEPFDIRTEIASAAPDQAAEPKRAPAMAGPAIATDHPVALFHMLHAVYRDDRAAERERDMQMWTLMLETQRQNAQLSLSQLHQFHEVMTRANDNARSEGRALDAERAELRQAPLLQQIEAMNTRLAELAQAARAADDDDDDDDEEAVTGALAKLGENPTDGEKILTGIASIMQTVATFAQTPMGEALAKRILNVEPGPPRRGRGAPMPDAAE